MAVYSEASRVNYAGDGTTIAFVVPFKFLADGDLVVMLFGTVGPPVTLLLNTDYTVSGDGNDNGGSLTMLVPPVVGAVLTIYRDPPVTQPIGDIGDHGKLSPATFTAALDQQCMIEQRTRDMITRAPRLAETDIDGAGAFDARGNRITNTAAPIADTDVVRLVDVRAIVNAILAGH